MISVLRIIRALFGFIGALGLLHFLFVPASRLSPIVEDETLDIFPNLLMLVLGFVAFIAIRELIQYLHRRKYGVAHPKLERIWNL